MGWLPLNGIWIGRNSGGASAPDGVPSNLVLSVISDTEIDGTFTEGSTNQDGFYVYISTDNITFTLKTTVLSGSFQATGLTENQLYYVKVCAYKGSQLSDFSNTASATPEKWYLSGSIPAANCVAAYTPIGVADLAASYVNIKNPGTYNLTVGNVPDFNNALGWIFNKTRTTDYLKTGIVPSAGWSAIVKFTDAHNIKTAQCLFGCTQTNKYFYIDLSNATTPVTIGYTNGGGLAVAPIIMKGVLAIAGNKAYRNGVAEASDINNGTVPTNEIYIGKKNGIGSQEVTCVISHIAFYNTQLTPSQVLSVTNRLQIYKGLMEQYVELGFGALIHYGLYTYNNDTYGAVADKDVDTFAPTEIDMDNWLDACVAAGMKYAILTVCHHDGFALWPTAYADAGHDPYSIAQTTWYTNNGSPDLVALWVAKCREKGLKVGLYYSIWDMTHEVRSGTDQTTDAAAYIAMIETRLGELLTNYGDIDILWLDGWGWKILYTNVPFATIYNYIKGIQPNCVVVNNEQTHTSTKSDIDVWELNDVPAGNLKYGQDAKAISVDNYWGYFHTHDQTAAAFKNAATINAAITNANSLNCNYLLGIYPDQSGHLPAAMKTILESL